MYIVCCARCRDVSWAMQLFGLRQVDSVVARAALYRDEADVAPEWVLDVDAVTETQVGPSWPASVLQVLLVSGAGIKLLTPQPAGH